MPLNLFLLSCTLLSVINLKVGLWIIGILVFDIVILLIYFKRKRKTGNAIASDITDSSRISDIILSNNEVSENAVFLFGDFKISTSVQKEITAKFSPLLKELFLMILLYSVKNEKGLSSSKALDYFWNGMPSKNAKNNMAVNLGKLRSLFVEDWGNCIVNKEGYVRFELPDNDFYCDYIQLNLGISRIQEFNKQEISDLLVVFKRGKFLEAVNYEWADQFKADLADKVIESLVGITKKLDTSEDSSLLIRVANSIELFDSVNEDALFTKCKAYVALKKHNLAKETYNRYVNEYRLLYDVEYERTFKSIID